MLAPSSSATSDVRDSELASRFAIDLPLHQYSAQRAISAFDGSDLTPNTSCALTSLERWRWMGSSMCGPGAFSREWDRGRDVNWDETAWSRDKRSEGPGRHNCGTNDVGVGKAR